MSHTSPPRVIVVGGGLSGLSACHTVLERGANVLLVDKNNFLGGNSTKATSGINGALTNTQISKGIKDSPQAFYEDTARSARDLLNKDLVKVLTYNSASAVEWLQDKFNLDLSLVAQLGGHSFARTHRGKERFPGMTITYALMERLEDLAKSHPDRVQILIKSRVTRLIKTDSGDIVGVEFECNGVKQQAYGPVVLATGGYAADFSEDSILKKVRPDIYHLPTTNGDWSTGDGLKLGTAIGANSIHLDKVQVHPTGLVDPADPDAKWKFLAAEALRGVGGLILDANGNRFCDELGHRDYVTGLMWKNKGPFRLVLNTAAAKDIEWHCKHYTGRGLMKYFTSGADLAKEMKISANGLEKTFETYNEIARTKKDPFGKKFFHNVPIKMDQTFYAAIIVPVLHYTMGGLQITPEAEVKSGTAPIPGLFAAGELCGEVHGANRLGGSSLLGCVVYGRVAGASAAKYLLSNLSSGAAAASVSGRDGVKIEVDPSGTLRMEVSFSGGQKSFTSAPAKSATVAPAAPAVAKAPKTIKTFSYEDVAKHNKDDDCWVVVNGEVLDVTKFMADHPGGKKAILLFAGRDATEEFNMLHKPDVVEKYAAYTIIGKIFGDKPKTAHL